MPLHILQLPKVFRPATSILYPPFKNGLYLEEYVYHALVQQADSIETQFIYIPVFWTNLQNHPGFKQMRDNYNILLQQSLQDSLQDSLQLSLQLKEPKTQFFTVVQHDDGPLLELPKNTIIFGSCTGTIPIPLIYEDVSQRLVNTPRKEKRFLASFIGTATTHPLRQDLVKHLDVHEKILVAGRPLWSSTVKNSDAETFLNVTLASKFCIAPRGYGRSSFRFFEAIQLGTIPVYVWDDVEWLPYKDVLTYEDFSISIQKKDISKICDILESVTADEYAEMQETLKEVQPYFTLNYLVEYLIRYVSLT
jgi:hypothetical protein